MSRYLSTSLSRLYNFLSVIKMDWPLWFAISLLNIIGIALLYSGSDYAWLLVKRQCLHIFLGQCLFFIAAQIHPSHYERWAPYFYILSLFLLMLVLLFGTMSKGAQRWLTLLGFKFQPSELLKLSTPLMLAWYLHRCHVPAKLKENGVAIVMIALPVLLIIKQPDLGTSIMIALSALFVLVLAGLSWYFIVSGIVLAFLSLPFVWHGLHAYQRQRLLTFLQPDRDPLGQGYHIIQSKIAIGSGGLLGRGWLHSTQSELHFLPEHATDFIFAVFSEQFGLLGNILLLMLFSFITIRSLRFSLQTENLFFRLFIIGVSLIFFTSVCINIAMVSGLLPIVGIPLPLISYGGSALLTYMIGFGIIVAMASHSKNRRC